MLQEQIDRIPELNLEKILRDSKEILVPQEDAIEGMLVKFYARFLKFPRFERALLIYTESRENQNLPNPGGYFEKVFSVVGKNSQDGLLYVIGEGIVGETSSEVVLQVPRNITVQNLKDKIGLKFEKIFCYRVATMHI